MIPDRKPPIDSDTLLRLTLEAAADCAVFLLDAEGLVAEWRPAAERLFGYGEAEILGQPFARFVTLEQVAQGEPERSLRAAAAGERAALEGWLKRKDGTQFWAASTLTAWRDEHAQLRGYALATRDRTEQRVAQDLLEKRERRFSALIEHSWDAVCLLAADGSVLYASPSTERIHGYSRQEFLGRKALDLVHPDDLPRIMEMFGRLTASPGQTLTTSFRYRHKDGRWIWLEGVGTNLLEEPSVRAIAANFRDVTRQREVEEIRSQLAAIVESCDDAIIGKTLDGVIVSWNKAAERLYGYTAEEMIGQPLSRLIPPGQPDELPGLRERIKRGERISDHETVRLRKDGTRVEVSLSISPVRDADGRIIGAAKITRDATARRKAEKRQRLLAESGAVLTASLDDQAILEGVARLVVPALADFCVIYVRGEGDALRQAAAVHIDPAKNALLRELARLYQPHDHPQSLAAQVMRTGQSELVPQLSLDALQEIDASNRVMAIVRDLDPLSCIVVPLSARGRTLGTIAVLTSESGRRYEASDREFAEELGRRVALAVDNARLYRDVREADRRKGEWIAMLAHELRNPLAPMLTGLHLLRRNGGAAVEQAGMMLERQVRHMARLVDDLLDVSRVARGQIRLQRERLDLARLVRTTATDLRPILVEAGVGLNVTTPDTPLWVIGDATRLAQVLNNLLDNAAKFTDRGGRVTVKLTVPGKPPGLSRRDEPAASPRLAELRVSDTGIGVAPEVLPRLFEPFSQADRSLHRTKGGLGLGLALVKGLTELHGGKVHASSAGLGRGTEFVVRLPLTEEPAALSDSVHDAQPSEERRRILVVEDNRDAADSLRMLLELMGHEVQVAYTGPDGVRLAQTWQPAVVVSDIGLPGLDGFGVARALRSNPSTAQARLIAVTGYGTEDDRRLARESGFDHLLTKPADPGVLQRLLAESA
ncbi:MAG TPA: PAS domain S-box protein [Gemmataceae bacterium]|nr:PAS domain S-box protein [Gemmataceae bacterium]